MNSFGIVDHPPETLSTAENREIIQKCLARVELHENVWPDDGNVPITHLRAGEKGPDLHCSVSNTRCCFEHLETGGSHASTVLAPRLYL